MTDRMEAMSACEDTNQRRDVMCPDAIASVTCDARQLSAPCHQMARIWWCSLVIVVAVLWNRAHHPHEPLGLQEGSTSSAGAKISSSALVHAFAKAGRSRLAVPGDSVTKKASAPAS